MKSKLYARLSSLLHARRNCQKEEKSHWADCHLEKIEELVKNHLPSGSGFDSGTQFLEDDSKPERLVFFTSFHHTDESGGYDGWTEHKVILTPSLAFGFELRVTGRDRNEIKEYIGETFHHALSQEVK